MVAPGPWALVARVRLRRRWHALRSCHPPLAARRLLESNALLNKSTIARQYLVLRADHPEPDRSTTRIQHALLAVRRQEPWGPFLLIACCPLRREQTLGPLSIIPFPQHDSESWYRISCPAKHTDTRSPGIPSYLSPPLSVAAARRADPLVYHPLLSTWFGVLDRIPGPAKHTHTKSPGAPSYLLPPPFAATAKRAEPLVYHGLFPT